MPFAPPMQPPVSDCSLGVGTVATIAGVICALYLWGCGPAADNSQPQTVEMPVFESASLRIGRAVWIETCSTCHLTGRNGAPPVTDPSRWRRRIEKGRPLLYRSAVRGVLAEDGHYVMPPRGGNTDLTSEQVRLAVDYKLAAIERLDDIAEGARSRP